jgi:hypothetical protein
MEWNMRKSFSVMIGVASISAIILSAPTKAKACWECWAAAGAVVVGGAIVANIAYANGYYAGRYVRYYGGYNYYVPPRAALGYYYQPYYGYNSAYYEQPYYAAPRYARPVHYVRPMRYGPRYYQPTVYVQPYFRGY